jgi:hypothetical protein
MAWTSVACGNTLKSLKYGDSMLMALQNQGYACISRQAGPAAHAVVS